MDKIPGSAGVSPGGGVDGAFERFLTAAIATIITIMFSWRLLSEEEQAAMAQGNVTLQRAPIGFQSSSDRNDLNIKRQQTHGRPKNLQVNDGKNDMKGNCEIIEKETTISIQSQPVANIDLQASASHLADGSLFDETEDSLADETLTTWDDYKWEEDDDSTEVVHTRRSIKDFINSSKTSDTETSTNEVIEETVSPHLSSPSLSFSQRFANFEYRDSGGDSGYIDLYPDVESDDSTSDSEHEYDIQVSDSDSDDDRGGGFYGVTSLDTIMEEEPYDLESDDSSGKPSKHANQHENNTCQNLQTQFKKNENNAILSCDINAGKVQAEQSTLLKSGSPGKIEKSHLSLDMVSKAGDILPTEGYHGGSSYEKECYHTEIDTTLMTHKRETILSESLKKDVNYSDNTLIKHQKKEENGSNSEQSPFILHLSKLQNKMRNSTQSSEQSEEQKTSEVLDDSLPPSPIRTCALDNLGDEAFSDTESCSSESVITVLSVRSVDSDQYRNIDLDDIGDEPLNSSVISIINNGQTPSGNRQSNQASVFDRNSVQMKFSENLSNIGENRDSQSISPHGNSSNTRHNTLYESGIRSSLINGSLNTDSSETGNSAGSSSTDSLISQENIHITPEGFSTFVNGFSRSSENSKETGENYNVLCPHETSSRMKYSSSSSDSSDPPLREYDPRDDDLAEFHFHTDSDEDSFYLIVGDEKNLRNFETYQNLNSIGLSSEYGDARASTTVNENAKGFTFSRTEEISTQFRKRTFVTDRGCNTSDSDTRSEEPLSPITSEDEDSRSSENELDDSGKVIIEFDLNKALQSDSKPPAPAISQESTYDDALITGTDTKIEQTERERKLDLNKYIIQSDSSNDPERNKNIDRGNTDESHSIDKNGLNRGQSKSYIDPSSLESNSFSAQDINNSEYTFSELLDKIENLGQNTELAVTEICEPISNSEKKHLHDLVETDISNSREKQSSPTNRDEEIDVKNTVVSQSDTKSKSKIETNVDDLWSNDTTLSKVNAKASSRETNVDDILGVTEQTEASNVEEQQKASRRETNVDDIFCDVTERIDNATGIGSFKSSLPKLQPSEHKRETNVDDIFIEDTIDNVSPRESETLQSKRLVKRNKTIETNADDFITETVTSLLCSPLESTPRNSIKRPIKSSIVLSPDDKHEIESDNTNGQAEIDFSYETFSNDLKRQQQSISSQRVISDISDGTGSSDLCSNNTLICDSTGKTQTNSSAFSSEYTKIPKSGGLSFSDKEIREDLFADRSHVTESNDSIQYEREASVTNDFENKYIGQSRQTIHPQLRQNLIHCSDVSNSIQNNEISNNGTINIPENYSNDETEKGIIISTQGVVQLDQDNVNLVKKNFVDNNTDKRTNFGNHPTNVDYNANIDVPKLKDNVIDFGVKPSKLNYLGVISELQSDTERTQNSVSKAGISCDEIELKIVEQDETDIPYSDKSTDSKGNSSSLESSSLISDSESLNSLEDSFNNLKNAYDGRRQRGHSESAIGRVVRTSVVVPSDLKKPRAFQGVKRKIQTNKLKQYTSILQQPITPEKTHVSFSIPEKQVPLSRLRIAQSRKQFLSEENISGSFEDKFLHYRNVLVTSTPRKYLKRHERHLIQSTESLPTDMSTINASHGNFSSMDFLPQYSEYHPRHIEELFPPGYDSKDSSYEHADYDKLHKDCIFSPKKREEIRHTTESLENMFEQLLRYGSVSSLAHETNLDDEHGTNEMCNSDIRDYVSFQYPLERAASMSALTGSSDGHRLPRKPGKGRFSSRQVPKSKSLQTLETNIDDVFENENEIGGELKKTPSVHELRVSKSLSKLNVPDWFKKSSFSRSDSTHSLFTYAGRQSSTSTIGSSIYPPSLTISPSPSITPGSNAVIIQKRVTPSQTSTAARLIRAPLPTTPEKSPIHSTSFSLPSDKFRKKDKKELKPIAIVPFAKLREMFERGSGKGKTDKKTSSPVKSPVKENIAKLSFDTAAYRKETAIDEPAFEPAHNHTSASPPPPPIPERKPILIDRDRTVDNIQNNHNHLENTQQRRAQVHFSDEEDNVSKSQEQNSQPVRKPVKPQSIKTSLPMPQFRFRRPMNVKPVQPIVQPTQSKKETTV